ncbi:MAG TPA: hypothetical protein PLT75_15280 [Spirochaetota bacterium]|nr:hypothetical protein [Spirochaetota bacterium]
MPKKKLTADQQKKVDQLAKTRDQFGKKSREGIRAQNQINRLYGVGPIRDWSNAPTSKQMAIAGKMKSRTLAEAKAKEKIKPVKKAVAGVLKGSAKTTKNIKTALNTASKKKKKTMYAGD